MRRPVICVASLVVAVALNACSSDSGSPLTPSSSGAATISGTARVAGASAARTDTASARGALANGRADAIEVCAVGTDVCVVLRESGEFELAGDFANDVELRFTGRGQDVLLTVPDVQPGQVITVTVELRGNRGTLQVESRLGGEGEKVDLCHVTGNGTFRLINVSVSAEQAHLQHGDGLPGEDVPGEDFLAFDEACNVVGPDIDIEKATNGRDADRRPGPSIPVGDRVTWTYRVTNTGTESLENVVVSDDDSQIAVECPEPRILAPGATIDCTATGVAVAGQYDNLGRVTADSADSNADPVSDTDPSHYIGREDDGPDDDGDGDGEKVELCHRRGNGQYHLIEVSINAEPAHRAHGDARPGEQVPDAPSAVFNRNCSTSPS